MQPMEALMNRGFYPYKLTAEDHLVIKKWKWRAGAIYGAVLLVLVLIVASGPYTKTEVAKGGGDLTFSSSAMAYSRFAP
jgi:hypothetical protein